MDVEGDRIVLGNAQRADTLYDFAAAVYDTRGRLDPRFGKGGKGTLNIGDADNAYAGGFGPGGAVVAIGGTAYSSEALVGDFAGGRWTKARLPDASLGTGSGTKMMDRQQRCRLRRRRRSWGHGRRTSPWLAT